MTTRITMPQLGESVSEGTVGRWLKQEGETIKRDEPLVEIITDKVTAEYPSPVTGRVAKILVKEDETVKVGAEIAEIEEAGASSSATPAASTSAPTRAHLAHQATVAPHTPPQRTTARRHGGSHIGCPGRPAQQRLWNAFRRSRAAWRRSIRSTFSRWKALARTVASARKTSSRISPNKRSLSLRQQRPLRLPLRSPRHPQFRWRRWRATNSSIPHQRAGSSPSTWCAASRPHHMPRRSSRWI